MGSDFDDSSSKIEPNTKKSRVKQQKQIKHTKTTNEMRINEKKKKLKN